MLEMQAFVDWVLDEHPVPTNEVDALKAFRIAAAAGESAWRGVSVTVDG